MAAYLFAAAAVLAVIPILVVFKVNLQKIKEDPSKKEAVQTRFFIGVALSETIPIILIMLAFIQMNPVTSISELYIPGLIVIFMMAYGLFFINLQKRIDVPSEAKQYVQTFAAIAMALCNSIPIIALVGLFTMMP
ncbi:hypothetical protein [Virgibacillus ainsalahensis]